VDAYETVTGGNPTVEEKVVEEAVKRCRHGAWEIAVQPDRTRPDAGKSVTEETQEACGEANRPCPQAMLRCGAGEANRAPIPSVAKGRSTPQPECPPAVAKGRRVRAQAARCGHCAGCLRKTRCQECRNCLKPALKAKCLAKICKVMEAEVVASKIDDSFHNGGMVAAVEAEEACNEMASLGGNEMAVVEDMSKEAAMEMERKIAEEAAQAAARLEDAAKKARAEFVGWIQIKIEGDTCGRWVYQGHDGSVSGPFAPLREDDADVKVVDGAANVSGSHSVGTMEALAGGEVPHDDECVLLSVKQGPGQTLPHPRNHCTLKPWTVDREDFCPDCFCWVCDVRARECSQWQYHCHATKRPVQPKQVKQSSIDSFFSGANHTRARDTTDIPFASRQQLAETTGVPVLCNSQPAVLCGCAASASPSISAWTASVPQRTNVKRKPYKCGRCGQEKKTCACKKKTVKNDGAYPIAVPSVAAESPVRGAMGDVPTNAVQLAHAIQMRE